MRSVPLHLEPGSDLRRSLEKLAQEQNASGFVLGVVGNLAQAAFQCPGKIAPTVLRGELEIITLQGTLSPEGVHLHLSLSDGECRVWGGHLEPGSRVLKGADLLVGLLDTTGAAGTEAAGAEASANEPLEPLEPRVTIAVRSGCPFSRRALRMLRTLGIPHRLIEPSADGPVPQIFFDGELIGGYDELAQRHGRGELEALRQA
jgi:predicted DNA-binding protein with PD1-like motif/glutaredoxin